MKSCPHITESWCLDCVGELSKEIWRLRGALAAATPARPESDKIREDMAQLQSARDSIGEQVTTAKRRARQTGVYSDGQWLRAAEHAHTVKGREIGSMQIRLGSAVRAEKSMRAAVSTPSPGWQPISTAPKDVELLLWVNIAVGPTVVKQGCWYHDDDSGEQGWIDVDGNVLSVTHWRNVPAPPRAETWTQQHDHD